MGETVDFRKGFVRDRLPSVGAKVEVLCRSGGKDFVLPLLCAWTDDGWIVAGTKRRLDFDVISWRRPSGSWSPAP